MDITIFLITAFLGGILPTFIWLYFWLQEDRKNPEPKYMIAKTFLFGMLTVPITAFFQFFWNELVTDHQNINILFYTNYILSIVTLTVWSFIEEILKYFAAKKSGLDSKSNDERIDPIIYMITAALGFAALENTFYLFYTIRESASFSEVFVLGNLRFIGATVLHIASSAVVGIFLSLSYYKSHSLKIRYLTTGIILATILHTIFNVFIIRAKIFNLIAFVTVWVVILCILLMFERIKTNKKYDEKKKNII